MVIMIAVLTTCYRGPDAHARRRLVLVSGVGAVGRSDDDSDARPTIVGSVYPLARAAERVAGDGYRVVNMTPAGAEPHDIELTPRDVEEIRDADLVVYLSGGFQPAVEEAVAERQRAVGRCSRRRRRSERLARPCPLLTGRRGARRALGRPEAARRIVTEFPEIDRRYRAALMDCARSTFVTDHAAFGHLAKRYGLTQLSLTGVSPEAEPAPRDVERLIEQVRAVGAPVVFAEPLLSDRLADTVARGAGADLSFLDPLEGLSTERLDAGADYESVMLDDLKALTKALGCR
jgi:zinc transport system substrate-binding protein